MNTHITWLICHAWGGIFLGIIALAAIACHGPATIGGSAQDLGQLPTSESNTMVDGITEAHNKARAAVNPVPAVSLPSLTWSETVAASAQSWADGCKFVHNSSTSYGENIYATTSSMTPAEVVAEWVKEKANYSYSSNTCSSSCGHYTQVVWRDSQRLGCAVKNCTTGSPFGSGSWQFWVCNYDPPGNLNGARPY